MLCPVYASGDMWHTPGARVTGGAKVGGWLGPGLHTRAAHHTASSLAASRQQSWPAPARPGICSTLVTSVHLPGVSTRCPQYYAQSAESINLCPAPPYHYHLWQCGQWTQNTGTGEIISMMYRADGTLWYHRKATPPRPAPPTTLISKSWCGHAASSSQLSVEVSTDLLEADTVSYVLSNLWVLGLDSDHSK